MGRIVSLRILAAGLLLCLVLPVHAGEPEVLSEEDREILENIELLKMLEALENEDPELLKEYLEMGEDADDE